MEKLPALHNARWSSHGSYALMAYFLIPNSRNQLENICQFISKTGRGFNSTISSMIQVCMSVFMTQLSHKIAQKHCQHF